MTLLHLIETIDKFHIYTSKLTIHCYCSLAPGLYFQLMVSFDVDMEFISLCSLDVAGSCGILLRRRTINL